MYGGKREKGSRKPYSTKRLRYVKLGSAEDYTWQNLYGILRRCESR